MVKSKIKQHTIVNLLLLTVGLGSGLLSWVIGSLSSLLSYFCCLLATADHSISKCFYFILAQFYHLPFSGDLTDFQ